MWGFNPLHLLTLYVGFACNFCDFKSQRKFNIIRHQDRTHGFDEQVFACPVCRNLFTSLPDLRQHGLTHRPTNKFKVVHHAFHKQCVFYSHTPAKTYQSAREAVLEVRKDAVQVLTYELAALTNIKVSLVIHVLFEKASSAGEPPETLEHCIRPKAFEIAEKTSIKSELENAVKMIEKRILDFLGCGSGWSVKDIEAIDLQIGKCPALNGACSTLTVSSLKDLTKMRSSPDDKKDCFARCVALHFVKDQCPKKLNCFMRQSLKWTPGQAVSVGSIPSFEVENPDLDLHINVIYSDGKAVYPVHKSTSKGRNIINLLLFRLRDYADGHYVLVDNLNKFMRKPYRGESGKLSYRKGFFCPNCLQHKATEAKLTAHARICYNHEPQLLLAPNDMETRIRFAKPDRSVYPCPLTIFFDFEAINMPNAWDCDRCKSNRCHHKTSKPCTQMPISYALVVMTRTNKILYHTRYSGLDAAKHFMSTLFDIEHQLLEYITTNKMLIMLDEDEEWFAKATHCYLCTLPLYKDRVRDHDHLTGFFIGAAHQVCNLIRKEKKRIPVFCHNLRGYDSHFIIREMGQDDRLTFSSALPANGEKLRSFKLNSYVFVDSYDFLQAPLGVLVSDLDKSGHKFPFLDMSGLYGGGDDGEKKFGIV